jgi:hypothetical protein
MMDTAAVPGEVISDEVLPARAYWPYAHAVIPFAEMTST